MYSYHFSCLNPPLDPANPPEGDWFCPKCSVSKSLNTLLGGMEKTTGRDFALPNKIRDFFAGVRTGDDGKYEEVASLPRINPRAARGSRTGRYDDPFLLRITDAKGKLIVCVKCGQTTNGRRPIIQCDFCPCAFHMDCLDPPLAVPPTQRVGSDRLYHTWMCPNHALHDMCYPVRDEEGYETMKRIRRPKNPRFIDVEVLPENEEEENLEDEEKEGITYRVSEKGIKLNFIERVKRLVNSSHHILLVLIQPTGKTRPLPQRKQPKRGISNMPNRKWMPSLRKQKHSSNLRNQPMTPRLLY